MVYEMNIKTHCRAWYLLITLWAAAGPALAVRRPVRSVIQCDRSSSVVAALSDDKSCRQHCEQTYVNTSRDLRALNKGLFQAHMKHELVASTVGQRVHLRHHPEQQERHQHHRPQRAGSEPPECCCLFEAPWPDYVGPQAIGRERDQKLINDKFWDKRVCMPLVMGVGLSRRTRDSYELLCKNLKERNPLTVLELMQFVEAAAYLNYMAPKHPSIMLVLHEKQVKRVQKTEAQELQFVLYDYLLDDTLNKQLWDLPGYRLETGRFRRLAEAKREIPNALTSQVVYRAFEELAVSQVLVDVAAAAYCLRELNSKQFHVPGHLLSGDYDKYDTDLGAYFTLANIDCQAMSQTNHRVYNYVNSLRSLLEPFREKGLYDSMAQKYQPLVDLLHTQKIHENLLRVNCRR